MTQQSASQKSLRKLGVRIALGLAAIGSLSGYWSFTISGTTSAVQWWMAWLQDVGTEMLGAAITILLVELVIYQKRDEASRLDRERMRRRDHFVDRLKQARSVEKRKKILNQMKQQNLLAGAWLYEVDLQGSDLQSCNLSEADLFEANLSAATLTEANLTDANLRRVNLSQANLTRACLEGADLAEADLQGADLSGARLEDADLNNAKFSADTRLPDGTHWQPTLVDLNTLTQVTLAEN